MDTSLQAAISLREAGKHAEARELLLKLEESSPQDPRLLFQLAWVHDVMGLEREAIPYYERALSLGLAGEARRRALLGLGSTYRTLGMYRESGEIFAAAIAEFPEAREFKVFYAMTLYNLQQYETAMKLLLIELAETSQDQGIQDYRRAIRFYAGRLDEIF
ncbi:tetratricopeptide repeat protein [Paenibacillus aceti]|uniref:Tetratrico peptide repeat group 5 domain-containing protein n=1 Tax=Paenibacillus aceti TaxID=1820010 RepID=A0ABQ1VSB9_9BACL|nr:tetratricopeptide repeat protein [Paenibacillus aceti]GGF95074.1 hypothetical protein GCM10010913_15790 [Paenibacillus aceti]